MSSVIEHWLQECVPIHELVRQVLGFLEWCPERSLEPSCGVVVLDDTDETPSEKAVITRMLRQLMGTTPMSQGYVVGNEMWCRLLPLQAFTAGIRQGIDQDNWHAHDEKIRLGSTKLAALEKTRAARFERELRDKQGGRPEDHARVWIRLAAEDESAAFSSCPRADTPLARGLTCSRRGWLLIEDEGASDMAAFARRLDMSSVLLLPRRARSQTRYRSVPRADVVLIRGVPTHRKLLKRLQHFMGGQQVETFLQTAHLLHYVAVIQIRPEPWLGWFRIEQ